MVQSPGQDPLPLVSTSGGGDLNGGPSRASRGGSILPVRPVLAVLLLLALLAPRAGAADETAAALEALESPAERVRAEGVQRLIARLPGARARVIEALDAAKPAVKLHLVEVLAQDGSLEAIHALLDALREADDLLAARIQRLLARDGSATRAVLATWKTDPQWRMGSEGRPDPRLDALALLLERAEAEELFLSRKSKSGGTGTYRGQYALLAPYREAAVELCVDILLDRAPQLPGVVRVGKFDFLRDTKINWNIDEIQSMAAHAFGEVAKDTDFRALLPLTGLLKRLDEELQTIGRYRWPDRTEYLRLLDRYTDLLIALYRVNPRSYQLKVDALIRYLRYDDTARDFALPSTLAILLLRVGRYEEAVLEYRRLLRPQPFRETAFSRAMTHYNLACAYAQWGLELDPADREAKYALALESLRQAVENHWSDVGWLDEDRDLDPIRERPAFQMIRREMVRAITPPDER